MSECPFHVGQYVTRHDRTDKFVAVLISFEPPDAPDPYPGKPWLPRSIHRVVSIEQWPEGIEVDGGVRSFFWRNELRAFFRPTQDGDREAVLRRELIDQLSYVNEDTWKRLPTEALSRIVDLVEVSK